MEFLTRRARRDYWWKSEGIRVGRQERGGSIIGLGTNLF
jgi:hypothetical protein